MQYLVDTGIWLRLFDRDDPEHATIRESLRLLRTVGIRWRFARKILPSFGMFRLGLRRRGVATARV
jgi:predicted nucleic acid-binding protein